MAKESTEFAVDQIRKVLRKIRSQPFNKDDGRRQRGLDTHAAIMGAAREVYIAEGYAGLSLGKVAERCGANKGNIAYYFPTKSDLLKAILFNELARYLADHIAHAEKRIGRPNAILQAIADFYVRDAQSNYLFFLQTWGYIASDSDARALVSEIYSVIIDFIGALVHAAKPNISKNTAKIAALEIMQTIEGLVVQFGMDLANDRTMRTMQKRAAQRISLIIESV